jgi:integrase/recombinase XerD
MSNQSSGFGTASNPLIEYVDWFVDHLRTEKAASPHTAAAYGKDLQLAAEHLKALGLLAWEDLEPTHLLAFQASLGPPLSQASARRKTSSMRSFLKFLRKNGIAIRPNLPEVGSFRKPKRLPKALTSESLNDLLQAPLLDTPQSVRDRALMELIYGAGLRITEALELEFEGLDLEAKTVRVKGKRGKTRISPLPDETVAWLKRYILDARPQLVRGGSGRVILSDRGKAMLRQTAYAVVAKYCVAAGIQEHVGPHTLRHTYAVHMVKGGADLRVVQELLGHESVATTQIYTELDLAEVQKRYDSAHPRS